MSTRTAAFRLDEESDADLELLASIHGSQTAAIKHALAEVAKRERLVAEMGAYVADFEAEHGALTDEELAEAEAYFD